MRARRGRILLIALAVLGAVVSASAAGLVAALESSTDTTVRLGLAETSGIDLGLRASFPLADDAAEQDRQVRAAIAESLAGVDPPARVGRIVDASATVARDEAGAVGRSVSIASIPGLADHATLVAGGWPDSAEGVTVSAAIADRLEAGVGDRLRLDDLVLTVTGVWTLDDPGDPLWLGDPALVGGASSAPGPVVVDESVWARLPDLAPLARWTIAPPATGWDAAELQTLTRAWTRIGLDWRDRVEDVDTLTRDGRLAVTAQRIEARIDALRAVEPIVTTILALVAVATLLELARLDVAARSDELVLLWARGRSERRTAALAGARAALAAGIGVALGATVGAVGSAAIVGPRPAALLAVGVVAAIAVAVAAGAAAREARRLVRAGVGARAAESRARSAVLAGVAGASLLAAVVAIVQLRHYGTPVIPADDGGVEVDPIAVAAPALGLLAGGMLALLVLPLLARRLDRAARGRAPVPTLAARSFARRLPRRAAPVLALLLATACLVLAGGYRGTWDAAFDRTAGVRSGADLLASSPADLDGERLAAIAAVPGVSAIGPARVDSVRVGDVDASIVAVAPGALETLLVPATRLDAAALAAAIRVDRGIALPAGSREVEVALTTTGMTAVPRLRLRVSSALGRLRAVAAAAPVAAGDGRLSYTVDLGDPAAGDGPEAGPARLLALDIDLDPATVPAGSTATVALEAISVDGAAAPERLVWSLVDDGAGTSAVPAPDGFVASDATRSVRLVPTPPAEQRLAVAVSGALAERATLSEGDTVSFAPDGSYTVIDATVTAVLDAVPASDDPFALLVDLGALQASALAGGGLAAEPNAAWVGSGEPGAADAVAGPVLALLPPGGRVIAADDPPARAALGTASDGLLVVAVVAAALAGLTVAAVASADARGRREEDALLRALGFTRRQRVRVRRAEWAALVGCGIVVGGIVGAVVGVLVVPAMVRAALVGAGDALAVPLRIDAALVASSVASLAALCAVVVAVVSRAGAPADTGAER